MANDDGFEGVARQLRGDGGPPVVPALTGPVIPGFVGQHDHQLADMIIDEPTSSAIAVALGRLVKDANASSGMVLDRAGQIIVWNGVDD